MPAEANKRRSLFWALGIFFLILISFRAYATSTNTMDSLPAPFTIEIDGKPILKVAADAADRTQAETGTEPAAIFELKDKRLQSDGHILARALAEDRSFKPKKVMWFKVDTDTLVHEVVATQEGEEYQLQFSGAGLTAIEGNVFADLMGSHPAHVVVKMQS